MITKKFKHKKIKKRDSSGGLFSDRNVRICIYFWTISIVGCLGILSGMAFTNFFGTMDVPSENAIKILHSFGILGIQEFQSNVKGVLKKNIDIPFDFVKGKLSSPEKVYIDIKFEDLKRLEYKRDDAIKKGALISFPEDYVPAKINTKNVSVDVKMRLKGDLIDHLEGKKWSYRIKVKDDDVLFGMKVFSLHAPEMRGYLSELIYHDMLKENGVISLRYDFIELFINGESKGIYAIEEHFDKRLIENNKLKEGVIVKFNEDLLVSSIPTIDSMYVNKEEQFNSGFGDDINNYFFRYSYVDNFENNKIKNNDVLNRQFEASKKMINSFVQCDSKTSDIFEVDKLSMYFAINTLMSSSHASDWKGVRFYFNPITHKLEPIGFDAEVSLGDSSVMMEEYFLNKEFSLNPCEDNKISFYNLIFSDKLFFEEYKKKLALISKQEFLDSYFKNNKDLIDFKLDILYKDYPLHHFNNDFYYYNQKKIQFYLNPFKMNESIEGQKKEIIIKGDWYLNEILIIPKDNRLVFEEGSVLHMNNGSYILSYSPVNFEGTLENPIYITSDDGTGKGFLIMGPEELSKVENVVFDNLKVITRNGLDLSGVITFYDSEVYLNNVLFESLIGEDDLNIVNSKFDINNVVFLNSINDSLDIDFSIGNISNLTIFGSGNDGVDFSGSKVKIKNLFISNVGDKGLSVGEGSTVEGENIHVNNAYICMANKDFSQTELFNINLFGCNYSIAVYQKKPEFGSASLDITNANYDVENSLFEEGSDVVINNKVIESTEKEVYRMLYN